MHLVFPLISSLLYVTGVLFLKRCAELGVGAWRTTFISNWVAALLFTVLWPLGGGIPVPTPWWQPAVVALLFIGGQGFTFVALQKGDVSVATPVLGAKVVLVALFVSLVLREGLSWQLWSAAALSTTAIALLNRNPAGGKRHHHVPLTIGLSLAAAASYALFDVLVQKWSPAWGAGRFLPVMMGFVGFFSLGLIPFFSGPLGRIARPAWAPLGWGALFIALQAIVLITTLAKFGDATAVNVVYSSRGLWSVLAVWGVGHWFGNREKEAGGGVMRSRLFGALLLIGAILLVLGSR